MIVRDGKTYASQSDYFAGRSLPECTLPELTQAAISNCVLELQSLLDDCHNNQGSLGNDASERFAAVVERIESLEATLLGDRECRLALKWGWLAAEQTRKAAMGRG